MSVLFASDAIGRPTRPGILLHVSSVQWETIWRAVTGEPDDIRDGVETVLQGARERGQLRECCHGLLRASSTTWTPRYVPEKPQVTGTTPEPVIGRENAVQRVPAVLTADFGEPE